MERPVLCCLCGVPTPFNPDALCINCLKTQVDITAEIPSRSEVLHCRDCQRYNRPPWTSMELESAELLTLCLRKIPGLGKVKLIDSKFIWTEPHSRRLKVEVTVQKEVLRGTAFQQTKVVEFVVVDMQCDDCKKTFTPHKWVANVQIRQRVSPPRTLATFEQVVISNSAHTETIKIKQKDAGLDFHFATKSAAVAFVAFAQAHLPVSVKPSKQLISQDDHSNTHNYKYTFSMEVVQICRHDLVQLPHALCAALGTKFALCYKVTSQLHFIDPFTARTIDLSAEKFWRSPFTALATANNLIEYTVLNVEEPPHRAVPLTLEDSAASTAASKPETDFRVVELEVARSSDLGCIDQTFFLRSHLGHLLKPGDAVMGYDLIAMTCTEETGLPDLVLVKKVSGAETGKRQRLEVAGRREDPTEEES